MRVNNGRRPVSRPASSAASRSARWSINRWTVANRKADFQSRLHSLSRFDASLQPLWHRFYGNLGTQVFAGTALRTTGGYLLTSGRDTADAHFISVTTDGAGNACGPHHGVPAPLAAGNLVSFAQSELATVTAGPNVQPAQGPGYRNSALATLNQCP